MVGTRKRTRTSDHGVTQEEKEAWIIQKAREDLLFYVGLLDKDYVPDRVHDYVAGVLQEVFEGKKTRVIVNMPPRHGKTRLVAEEFGAWVLGKDPTANIVIASYGQALSNTTSLKIRDRLEDPLHQKIFPTKLHRSKRAVKAWNTTEGGGTKAVGTGVGLTGEGADYLIIDDPFKDYEEANSELVRNKVWNWFLSVAFTRLSPTGRIIIIMTRWHRDDLVGRLQDPERKKEIREAGASDEEFQEINLRAIAPAEGDLLGRKEGEALAPSRYTAERLRSIKAVLSERVWAALYGGDPVQIGGNEIPVDKITRVDPEEVPEGLRWVRFWDLAATEDQRNDYTAGIKGALGPPPGVTIEEARAHDAKQDDPLLKIARKALYLDALVFGRWKWPKARERIVQIALAEKIMIGIESVAGFITAFDNLVENLQGTGIVAKQYGAQREKLTRALPWIERAASGNVYLVNGPWILDWERQALPFPDGDHDDFIDATSGVHTMLTSGRKILVA